MSKSYGNTIEIFPESEKKLQKRCNKIITSSTPMGEPLDYDGCNLYSLISLFLDDEGKGSFKSDIGLEKRGYGTLLRSI